MAGLIKQTVVLTFARFANYGLMLVSPVILVRLLSVEQFGQYRQFILYASFMQLVAAFSFAESLLYFIPAHSRSVWRVVAQTNLLVFCSSCAVVIAVAVADVSTHGAVVGDELLPLVAYVMLFVNLDFWEYYFLATHRAIAVLSYTSSRLVARMAVVIGVAYFTRDVRVIVWSLVALEAVRLAVSAAAWRAIDQRSSEPRAHNLWRDQLRFCVPAGLAMFLYLANRNVGGLAISKMLGPAALARYTIGTYAEFVCLAVGNSIAAVVLPEMVRRLAQSRGNAIYLWQQTAVVSCMLMLPAAALLAYFARPVIITIFGASYSPAIPVFQIHMLFLLRACFDFSPALRAIGKTRPLVYSNATALAVNSAALVFLLPRFGITGAVTALVGSSFVEAGVLCWCTSKHYEISIARLLPLPGFLKVLLATLVGTIVFLSPVWAQMRGVCGVIVAGALFYALVVLLLWVLRVEEFRNILARVKAFRFAGVGRSA